MSDPVSIPIAGAAASTSACDRVDERRRLDHLSGQRVVVAMSGGVDSSVAAALLVKAGCDVVGITLQLYDHGAATGRKGSCCAGQDIHDARRVAETLGIPHYVLDYEQRFASTVIKSFAESYAAGETPIPCVTCNQQIKFHDLLDTARDLGASLLATGHYVQKRDGATRPALYRGADVSRDQSYFLFATSEAQLNRLIFPIGGYQKPEVRALAREFGLPVSDKPDSQDICFVPNGRYTDVVARLNPNALVDGDIVHVDGRQLGRHSGIAGFTVGQRKGLKIPLGEPLYVVRIEAAANRVVVGPRDCLQTTGLILRDVNWLGDSTPDKDIGEGLDVFVRIRSSQAPMPARLHRDCDGTIRVGLPDGEMGVAKGQACVFYTDHNPEARVLGGGWIARTLKPEWPHEAGLVAGVSKGALDPIGSH